MSVDAATTATDQLTANANGTFTLNQALAPVRKRQNGAWKPLDATLVKRADGSIGPAMSTSDLTLSGGGSSPLAVMKTGARSLALTLPSTLTAKLPAPTLAGPTATYALLNGVDLQVTADTQGGFSEVLVIKDATAAANPALASLAFSTKTTGVDLATDSAGNITAKDSHGTVVFSAPAPNKGVWDSATNPAAPTVTDPSTGTTLDARSGAPAASSKAGPGAAAHTAPLKAVYGSGKITLTPDPTLLTGKNTIWPLYIDPTYSAGGGAAQAWTYVNSSFPDTSYSQTSDTEGLRVGDQAWTSPYFVGRAFAQMSIASSIYGSTVMSSRFYATETYAPSCSARNVELWFTGAISAATTWNNQPSWNSKSDTQSVANGYSSACPTASVGFDTTSLMQSAANGSWSNVTLGLRASDETDPYGWKKFQPSAMYMSTTYDHAPNTPGPLTTSPNTACGAATPTIVGNGDVTLYAGVSDPDGGTLGVAFTVVNSLTRAIVASSTTSNLPATSGTTASLLIPRTTLVNSSAGAQTPFEWTVYTSDGTFNSPASTTCRFAFDPTHPGAPTVTQNATSYTVGTAAGFTFTANSTGSTPASYLYQLNGAAPGTVSANAGTASVNIAPTRRVNTLTVTAVSPGGNIGDTATVILNAKLPATAVENDLTGAGHADLTVVGGQAGLPPGLWLASGGTASTINTAATNIGAQGTALNTNGTPTDWNGTQAITGHFGGTGFNDVLDYNPSTGVGHILYGDGDGSPLSPDSSAEVNITSNVFQSSTTKQYATHVASGGSLSNIANGNTNNDGTPVSLFPDILLTVDGSLYLDPASATPAAFSGFNAWVNLGTNPTGKGDWTGWTIATTVVNYLPALFARSDSGGQLYYYSPTAMQNLLAGASVTPVELATSGWDATSKPTLEAADINGDGYPDLWSVSGAGAVTANFLSGTTTPTLTSQATPQTLAPPSHSWALNDSTADGTQVTTAADPAGSLALAGQAGANWSTKDLFTPDVALNTGATPTTGSLAATGSAVNVSGNFTVSAWAQPSASGGVVLSQDGTYTSGLLLYPDVNSNQWFFCLATTDSTGWPYDCARGGTVNLTLWTHLTATYNSVTKQMAIYVNGVEAGTGTHTPASGSLFRGPFTVGDFLSNSKPTHAAYFSGRVSQIQTWNQALTPYQVGSAAGPNSAITLPSDGTVYPTGRSWQLGANAMAFNQGQLTITVAGIQQYSKVTTTHAAAVMTLQTDGNLVAYPTATDAANQTNSLWSTSTAGHSGDGLIFQPDGNLVLYSVDGTPLWSTNTASNPAYNRVIQAVEGNALHEVYPDASGWHDNAVAGVGGGITALGFAYGPTGLPVIEASEGGVLHEISCDSSGNWHDSAVAGVGGGITALGFAYDPTGLPVIEASESGVLHEINKDSSGNWHDNPVLGVGGGITALGFTYTSTGLRVIEASEGGVLHEIYKDSSGNWYDNPVLGVGGNITPLGSTYSPTGGRVIEASEGGVLHEIYNDTSGVWHDNPVVGVGSNITALSMKVLSNGGRIIEASEGGVLHEIYTDSSGWHDNPIAGTAGSATALSFALH
ncbi:MULTISPECIES: LamG-like jellyroll fold domain-containing protein [unclassified Kitasatospora]|uniref:LamG-like jellyroll fold domain-containing protein n=1 Tax=unclassified Kitasatospora TaxID=2633591 RepID=UPI00247541E1|nr:LamG-like jellyroll fold domain-containing protein [Kitasatospora sp. MAP12-44]